MALKRVIACQLAEAMKHQRMTRTALAERMGTSRAAVDRLLTSNDGALTLDTLTRAVGALEMRVSVDIQ